MEKHRETERWRDKEKEKNVKTEKRRYRDGGTER